MMNRTASSPHASAREDGRRRVLLTVSGVIPADLDDQIADERAPLADYVALAEAMDAELLDVADARRRSGRLGRVVERLGGPGPLLAWACFRRRGDVDVIVSDGEQVGLPLALLSKVTRRRCRHVMIAHLLSARKKVLLTRALRLLRHVDRILVYSSWQRQFVHEELHYPEDHVVLTTFMVDTQFYDPRRSAVDRENLICSAGLERRDYPTLLEAVRGLGLSVVVAAASPWSKQADSTAGERVPGNVDVRSLGFVDLRELYATSAFVVMPLQDVEFQAGVTTILEAMAMGKAVICSRTRGQTDVIVDGETGIYVTPGDARELRSAITALLADPERARRLGKAGRAFVERECDVRIYAERLAAVVAAVQQELRT